MARSRAGQQVAWKALSTVLHKLRERLSINLAAPIGGQLPLLVRGVYYDQFEPEKMPSSAAIARNSSPKSANGSATRGRSTPSSDSVGFPRNLATHFSKGRSTM